MVSHRHNNIIYLKWIWYTSQVDFNRNQIISASWLTMHQDKPQNWNLLSELNAAPENKQKVSACFPCPNIHLPSPLPGSNKIQRLVVENYSIIPFSEVFQWAAGCIGEHLRHHIAQRCNIGSAGSSCVIRVK